MSAWLRESMLFYLSLINQLKSYWSDANGGLATRYIFPVYLVLSRFLERLHNLFEHKLLFNYYYQGNYTDRQTDKLAFDENWREITPWFEINSDTKISDFYISSSRAQWVSQTVSLHWWHVTQNSTIYVVVDCTLHRRNGIGSTGV